ncbi:hypothetical protein HDU99_002850, partial [Rhizoclosmatium hyalinum]
ASRKFRERKEQYVRDLEAAIAELGKGSQPTEELRQRVAALEAENALLRQVTFTFNPLTPSPDLLQTTSIPQPLVTPTVPPLQSGSASPFSLDDLFPANDMIPSLQFETFKDTHNNLNLDDLLAPASSTNTAFNSSLTPSQVLAQLVNTPLLIPPTAKDVIAPHFIGVSKILKETPSLAAEHPLVDELIEHYMAWTDSATERTPTICKYKFGMIKITEGKLLEKCVPAPQDLDKVLYVFHTVKRKYLIEEESTDLKAEH